MWDCLYEMGYKLSPSSLKLMDECPRCFWLTHHKVWKRPQGIFPTLPSGMDRILKEHFDRFMERGVLPPEICESGECVGMKIFDDKEKMVVWQNNFKGISWGDGDGNVLRGAVDNILVRDGKLIVLDYKTRGYPLKEGTAEFSQNQLDTYNFLLRKNGYETEDFGFLLFYIPKSVTETGEVVFDTELVKMPTDVSKAEDVWRGALVMLEGECPGETCEWCMGVKKNKSFKKIREEYPKAYVSWDEKEEMQLLSLFKDGKSYSEIAELLGRKKGGVISRLRKLGAIRDGK